MAKPRLSMRKIKEVLRISYQCGLSARQVALSANVSRSTVKDYLVRAERTGISWPAAEDLTEQQIDAKVELLILDDLFLAPLNDAERKDLLEIIEDRHG